MSFFEKYTNSRLYYYIDQFFRVILTNFLALLTLIFGLFIFGIGVSIIAVTYITKLIFEKYDGPIVPVFIKIVKVNLAKSIKINLSFLAILAIFVFNTYFFFLSLEHQFSYFSLIGFVVMGIACFISLNAYIHTLLLLTCYENTRTFNLIKNGYILTFGFIARSIIFSLLSFLIIGLILIIPILGIFVGFFLEGIIIYFCFLKGYKKIPNFENKDDVVSLSYIK